MEKIIFVVGGIFKKRNQVLLTSRPESKSHAGYWEFPGGKLELNENHEQALVRELNEELGIVVKVNELTYLTSINQKYQENNVLLTLFTIRNWFGEFQSLEGQSLYWHNINLDCKVSPLLPTTKTILNILFDREKYETVP